MEVRGQGCRDIGVWDKGIWHRGGKTWRSGARGAEHRVIAMRSLVRHGGIAARAQWAGLESCCSPKQADDKGGLRATEG